MGESEDGGSEATAGEIAADPVAPGLLHAPRPSQQLTDAERARPVPRGAAQPEGERLVPAEPWPDIPNVPDRPQPIERETEGPVQETRRVARVPAVEPPILPELEAGAQEALLRTTSPAARADIDAASLEGTLPTPAPTPVLPAPGLQSRQPSPDRPETNPTGAPIEPPAAPEAVPSERSPLAAFTPVAAQPAPPPPRPEVLPMVAPAPTRPPEVTLPRQPTPREADGRPVHVRIGRIEIRARGPRTPEPPSPAPAIRGFDRYLRVRTYSREDY